MALNLANFPAAIQAAIQDGILEGLFQRSLQPMFRYRAFAEKIRHQGGVGEKVVKTRPGLITPDTAATAIVAAGQDPGTVTRGLEQYAYQIASFGKGIDSDLPGSFVAAASMFVDNVEKLAQHSAATLDTIARDRLHAAYNSGNTWATAAVNPAATTIPVQSLEGFTTVLVNGVFTTVSAQNPLPITIAGTARNVTGFSVQNSTITVDVAIAVAQFDAILANDRARVFRQNGRTTDRAIVANDTATIATFRSAKAAMLRNNVPGLDGNTENTTHVCFISPEIATVLFADAEFHDAIQAQGLSGPFASGALGDYAGIRFVPNNQIPVLSSGLQTTVHECVMIGMDALVEAYLPETEFQSAAPGNMAPVINASHLKMAMDPAGVSTMIARAPQDALGRKVRTSWVANVDYCVPTDALATSGPARFKRAALVKVAGPA